MSTALSFDTINEIQRLRSLGLNYKTIANRLRCSTESVRRYSHNVKLDESILFDEDSVGQRIAKPKPTFAGRVARPSWFEEENIEKMITSGR